MSEENEGKFQDTTIEQRDNGATEHGQQASGGTVAGDEAGGRKNGEAGDLPSPLKGGATARQGGVPSAPTTFAKAAAFGASLAEGERAEDIYLWEHGVAVEPWPEPVSGKDLLDALEALITRFVVLPKWGSVALALWVVHTYAWLLRRMATYIGIESPEKRCGKTTALKDHGGSRMFSRDIVAELNGYADRPWMVLRRGKALTERWLSQQLSPYGVRPKTIWIGETSAKGYMEADLLETFRRYIPKSAARAFVEEVRAEQKEKPPVPAAAPKPVAAESQSGDLKSNLGALQQQLEALRQRALRRK